MWPWKIFQKRCKGILLVLVYSSELIPSCTASSAQMLYSHIPGGARGVPLPPPNFSGLFLKVLHRPLTAPLVAKLALQWPHQMKMSGSAPAPIWHTLRHRFLFSKNSQRSLNFVLTILLNTCQHLPCFLTSPGVSLFSWRFAVTWQINKLQITVLAVQGCLATHEGFLVHSSWGRQQSKARHYCDRTQLFCIAR